MFIDEIDKLCAQNSGDLKVINRVQQELLPVIQGIELNLNNGEVLHTKSILFIAGGAFPGLISSERSGPSSLPITPQVLESYGMLPELAGRLGNIVQFNALDKNDLKKIILGSKNSSLKNYITKYKVAYQIDLRFSEQTIDYIAEVAALQKTGARAINAMIFNLMEDITFNIKKYKGKPLCIEKEEAIQKLEKFMRTPPEEMDPSLSHLYL